MEESIINQVKCITLYLPPLTDPNQVKQEFVGDAADVDEEYEVYGREIIGEAV